MVGVVVERVAELVLLLAMVPMVMVQRKRDPTHSDDLIDAGVCAYRYCTPGPLLWTGADRSKG